MGCAAGRSWANASREAGLRLGLVATFSVQLGTYYAETGTTPGKWLLAQRLHHARTLLESSDLPIETVASRVTLRHPPVSDPARYDALREADHVDA